MLRHPDYTRTRLAQLADRMFAKIYPEIRRVDALLVSERVDRITLADAEDLTYRPVELGEQFGPLWATYWFKGQVTVPQEWQGGRVDLLWVSHSEATLWKEGKSLQGLNYEPSNLDRSTRPDAVLVRKAQGGETVDFQVEMACNRVFGTGPSPYTTVSPFVLDQCDIAPFDPVAWELYFDFSVLQALEAEGSKDLDDAWAGELLSELNRFANVYDPEDRDTWPDAHKIIKPLYSRHNATRVHELSAIGHAHIDTAWLWPLGETHRKCERTFSSQVTYMDEYPEYKFACSQAYQYAVIQERNPELYGRIQDAVKREQFVPVGGTWIEPDCNIPSGESLARQFLYGQRFFQKEFGATCREFWNPDVFGYNGQLPQIMRQAGITRFLTQKLSWNRFNKPHFHTFNWQGIDGSEVLAHFPPADTYNASAEVPLIRDNARHYKDHDRSRHSLMLFGWGDGGGGPTRRMLEILRRAKDLQGLPRTQFRSSDEFFTLLEEDCTDRATMVGELYFEYHRGTYTTQAATKRNNRKCEFLLHDLEFLAAAAHHRNRPRADGEDSPGVYRYPQEEIDRLWKLLLLNQFHDILPGSSITLVYEDTARDYEEIHSAGQRLRDEALRALMGRSAPRTSSSLSLLGLKAAPVSIPEGKTIDKLLLERRIISWEQYAEAAQMHRGSGRSWEDVFIELEMVEPAQIAELKSAPAYIPGAEPSRRGMGPVEAVPIPFNTTGFHRREVVERGDGALTFIEAPPYSAGQIGVAPGSVDVAETDDSVVMENSQLRAEFSREGLLLSLVHKTTGRETMAESGNRLEIYDDHPTAWDAWDVDPFHLETRQDCLPAENCAVTLQSPLRVEVTLERPIGKESRMRQTVRLDAGSPRLEFHTTVEWHESHKMLKVAFPVNVRALNATYEMQFGCVERPTHYNTMYDLARYEVPGHKWVDLSEHGFGASLLSESKYGFSTYGNAMRISLLRSPKEPDPEADMGDHQFSYAIFPHADGWREAGVVAEGYRFNQPFLWTEGRVLPQSFASVDSPNLVLDTIKKAEDDDTLVLRLYECHGARGTASVKCSFPISSATFCNLLEEDAGEAQIEEGSIRIPYSPFQIISVKVR